MKPLVSILIPAYNAEKWIADTIRSALVQTWSPTEIIVVDDGSKDQTLAIARQFASKSVNVFSQSNLGAAAARNKAYSLCQGDYIQWLDADDLLSGDKIARQMEAVAQRQSKRTLMSCGWAYFIRRPAKAKFKPTLLWQDLSPLEWLLRKWENNLHMQTATWLVSRELTEAAGPWDTRLLGDDDGEYFFRVILQSNGIRFVPDAKVFYRKTDSSRLSYIGKSNRKMEAHFLGMRLQIDSLCSFNDSQRVRMACVTYLQTWLSVFCPNRPDIIEEAQQISKSLGGKLLPPELHWRYKWLQKTVGWSTTKMLQEKYNKIKFSVQVACENKAVQLEKLTRAGDSKGPLLEPLVSSRPAKNLEFPGEGSELACESLPQSLPKAPVQAGYDEPNSHHFKTDHLLANLKDRMVSSAFITLVAQGVQFALTLLSTMILARLLTPRDFGLVAMVWAVLGLLRVFKEAGLSTATVQRDGITHAQVSNLFWINVAVSGLVSLLVALVAPLIAWFYREPRLVTITIALSISFFLAGLVVQHMALLNRQMRFKAIALIQVGSLLAGILVGVVMAWLGYGYWSLVGLNLTTGLVLVLMTWTASGWRPQQFKTHSGTRPLLHFGANLTAGTLVYSLARGLDGLLIGRVYGAFSVGLYTRAATMLFRPVEQVTCSVEAMFIPAFSRLQDQRTRYRDTFISIYEAIALISFLFSGICLAMAHPMTLIVLGAKWESAAIIFSCLTFAVLQSPMSSCATWLIASQGRGRDSFSANLLLSITIAVSFIVGLPYGAAGVALSYSASCLLIQMPIVYYFAGRSGPVSAKDLWNGFFRQLPVWGVVFLVGWLVRLPIPDDQPLKELLFAIPASLLAAAAFIFVYPPSRRVAANALSTLRDLKNQANRPDAEQAEQADDRVNAESKKGTLVDIAVVIPAFNRGRLVGRAIESALNQTVKARQIIVVDDGSTDNTPEVCRKYGHLVEYVHQANAGVSQARNHGIRLARHTWVAFLDSDDYWTSNHLEKMTAAIEGTSGRANFYFSDMQSPGGTGEMTLWSKIGFEIADPFVLMRDGTDWMLAQRQPASIQCSVFKTATLMAAGGFDEHLRVMEDTELFCRLGIGSAVCAVNALGCVQTSHEHQANRLTAIVHCYTEDFWKNNCRLWGGLQSQFQDLPPVYRRTIAYNLAVANWRLTRFYWRVGRFSKSVIPFLRSAKSHPNFLFRLLRYRSAAYGNVKLSSEKEIRNVNSEQAKRATEKSA